MYPREEPSPAKPFFKFRTAEKVYTKPLEFRIKPYKLLGFSTKPFSAVQNFKKGFAREGSSR
jgi:hypothetical protein